MTQPWYSDLRTGGPLAAPAQPPACIDCERTDAPAYGRTPNQHWLCMGCLNALHRDPHAPYVSLMPGRMGGRPTINNTRLSTDVLAGFAEANGIEDACDNYGMRPEDVAMATWFETTWQLRRRGGKAALS